MVSARLGGFNLILYGSGSYGERRGAAMDLSGPVAFAVPA
jgi:hypothetical protein